MVYLCNCGKEFGTPRALSGHHRRGCKKEAAQWKLLATCVKERTLAKSRDRASRHSPLTSSSPGPSTLSTPSTTSRNATEPPSTPVMIDSEVMESMVNSVIDSVQHEPPSSATANTDGINALLPSPEPDQGMDLEPLLVSNAPAMPPKDIQKDYSQRPKRPRQLPKRLNDFLPHGPAPLRKTLPLPLNDPPSCTDVSPSPLLPHPRDEGCAEPRAAASLPKPPDLETLCTDINDFGLYREYVGIPSHLPDEEAPSDSFVADSLKDASASSSSKNMYFPFPNFSSFRLSHWFWNSGERKSKQDRQRLLKDVLLAEGFNLEDLQGVNLDALDTALDNLDSLDDLPFNLTRDGWERHNVEVQVPRGSKPATNDDASERFTVTDLWARPITEIIKSVFSSDPAAKDFHFNPFAQYWQPSPDSPRVRVYDELYNSQAWIDEHSRLQQLPPEPDCSLPRAIASIMLWSDSTHLANFGTAKLWPVYMFFGNQSKWLRCKRSSQACHHLAYLPSVPDTFQDFFRKSVSAKGASGSMLAHCRRELFHAAWKILLDEDFLYAYEHGIVVNCADGVTRRLYPRIFTYSADYPEKVLLATVRDMGECPCPRCLIRKDQIHHIGTKRDRISRASKARVDNQHRQTKVRLARNIIYEKGRVVNSKGVEQLLKSQSLVPTENAFSARLSQFGFDFHVMLAVDLMHEFELGVWKALFTHLIRMIYAEYPDQVGVLNERFRDIPSFGRDTIRRFCNDVSAMKKLAARDFEDMLQCAIPAFEGIFEDKFNRHILDLLFVAATWHGLAKLRMHTDQSLRVLDETTTLFGRLMRHFTENVCPHFNTHEMPREVAARVRQQGRNAGVKPNASTSRTPLTTKRKKVFNMHTYKMHALGDYVATIRLFGTTDSYSTQRGELEHRTSKATYSMRTSKNDAISQMAKIERRKAHLNQIADRANAHTPSTRRDTDYDDPLAFSNRNQRYHIALDQNNYFTLDSWLYANKDDPAFERFIPRLQDHLLARILGKDATEEIEYSDAERNTVRFHSERIYTHSTVRLNYTTYDIRRGQDSININSSHRDIMLRANEHQRSGHPYWYARVLGVFHVKVLHVAPNGHYLSGDRRGRRMDFLWVRWLGIEPGYRSGWKARRLDRVGFVPGADAFGFVNPEDVIRGAHLIPAFALGRTKDFLGPSMARDPEGDWLNFYVNRFVDRDMLMRYLGGGVGHTDLFKSPPRMSEEAKNLASELDSGIISRYSEGDTEEDGTSNSIRVDLWEEGNEVQMEGEDPEDEEHEAEMDGDRNDLTGKGLESDEEEAPEGEESDMNESENDSNSEGNSARDSDYEY